jgi:hypothetical protein
VDEKGKPIIRQDWQQLYRPKMTQEGISSSMGFLRTVCDKSISLTDIGEEQIDILIKQNCDAWLDSLLRKSREFGITDNFTEIYYPARNLIFTRLRSAIDGMTMNAISKTTNVTEQHNTGQPQEQEQGGGCRIYDYRQLRRYRYGRHTNGRVNVPGGNTRR